MRLVRLKPQLARAPIGPEPLGTTKITTTLGPKFLERKIAVSVKNIYLRNKLKSGQYCIYFYNRPAVRFQASGP